MSQTVPTNETPTAQPSVRPLGEFLEGVLFSASLYNQELRRVESRSTGYVRRQLREAAESTNRSLVRLMEFWTSAGMLAIMTREGLASPENIESFNSLFPRVLSAARDIPAKDNLVARLTEASKILGLKLCPYCGKLRPPHSADEPSTCPAPARCRKGLRNRQDWLRRKSKHQASRYKTSRAHSGPIV
jgi:hypothetical protein